MKLYGYPNTRSLRALWAAEEAGLDYEYQQIDLRSGEARRPPFIDLNPGGKLPVLEDGDLVLCESAAICTYIASQARPAPLLPENRKERARYDQWCFFALAELEQPLWTLAKHRFVLPEERREPAIFDTARWEFSVAAKVLAKGLEDREYIVGDRFSAADVLVAHALMWARKYELPFEHDRVAAYLQRISARPALAKALAREKAAG